MELLKLWLEKKQYDVKFTGDLGEVVNIMNDFDPSLIMIDIEQRSVIPAIKGKDDSLPLLIMAGYTYRGSYADFPRENIIEKPFTMERLQQKIDRLLDTVAP